MDFHAFMYVTIGRRAELERGMAGKDPVLYQRMLGEIAEYARTCDVTGWSGIGIPERELDKLGKPFEQVVNQFTHSHRGSGLGLAISRSLIEMHGGHIDITSKEGEGTTVICVLPTRPVLVASEAAESA